MRKPLGEVGSSTNDRLCQRTIVFRPLEHPDIRAPFRGADQVLIDGALGEAEADAPVRERNGESRVRFYQ